ncbi:thioesterase II family protein [Paenibacillus taichungensis]|uniref:thioesterase II family protein n=1 Tax=Paenibacillus taichungensis TaxID=484184 RepID=UPI0038D0AA0F
MREPYLNLICLPYAGGSQNIFNEWKRNMMSEVNVIPVELSGRGKRMDDPLYNDFNEAIEDIYKCIKEDVFNQPYAIAGHSMGGLLAYELANKLVSEDQRSPEFLVLSGKNPPHIRVNTKIHQLSEEDMITELLKLGGIKPEFIQYQELMSLFLPIIRSDFKLVETYEYLSTEPLKVDIHIMYGSADHMTTGEQLYQWDNYSHKKCFYKEFKGDHFFIETSSRDVVDYVNGVCMDYINNHKQEA